MRAAYRMGENMRAKVSSRAILLPALALLSLPSFGQPPDFRGQQNFGGQPNFGGQGPTPTMGQELTLFQDDGNRGFPGGSQPAEAGTPGVIVKGIYRFGNTYHVSLQSGEGGAVQQFTWQQGQSQAPVLNG